MPAKTISDIMIREPSEALQNLKAWFMRILADKEHQAKEDQ